MVVRGGSLIELGTQPRTVHSCTQPTCGGTCHEHISVGVTKLDSLLLQTC